MSEETFATPRALLEQAFFEALSRPEVISALCVDPEKQALATYFTRITGEWICGTQPWPVQVRNMEGPPYELEAGAMQDFLGVHRVDLEHSARPSHEQGQRRTVFFIALGDERTTQKEIWGTYEAYGLRPIDPRVLRRLLDDDIGSLRHASLLTVYATRSNTGDPMYGYLLATGHAQGEPEADVCYCSPDEATRIETGSCYLVGVRPA